MASFRQYYGLDFMTALYETHTPRELVDMITWLPDGSPLSASMRGGREHLGWTWERILSVYLLEQSQMNGFNFVKANTPKSSAKTLTPPKPIPFPGRKLAKQNRLGDFGPMIRALKAGRRPDLR